MKKLGLSVAFLGMFTAAFATADIVDLTQLPLGDQGTTSVTVDGVTFVGAIGIYNTSDFFFPNNGGSICSFNAANFDCQNDMTVKFNAKVKRVKFRAASYDDGDSVTITVYRGNRNLGNVVVNANGPINLRSFRGVTRLEFDDFSTGAGFSFGAFHFRPVVAPAAPAPTVAGPATADPTAVADTTTKATTKANAKSQNTPDRPKAAAKRAEKAQGKAGS